MVCSAATLTKNEVQESTMKKLLAVLTVLTVAFGALSAVPANASKTYLFAPNQNQGANS
jgi:hypothetical protein